MRRKSKIRLCLTGLVLALLGTGGLALAGVGATGAYLSNTASATQSSSIAYVSLSPGSVSPAFSNLQPGVPQSRVIVLTNNGTVPETIYIKERAATGLPSQDSVPSLLTVTFAGAASGNYSSPANVSPASTDVCANLAAGATCNLTITLSLDLSAGGTYNNPTNWNQPNLTVTVPFELVGFQQGVGWQSIS